MAIAKIKKIRIIAHKSIKEALLDVLQESGAVHISRISEITSEAIKEDKAQDVTLKLSQIDEIIRYLGTLQPKKGGLLPERFPIRLEEFKGLPASFDHKEIYDSFRSLINQQKEIFSQRDRLLERKKRLIPWEKLRLSPKDIRDTKYTAVIFGTISHKDFPLLLAELDKNKLSYDFNQIGFDKEFKRLLFVCLNSEEFSARDILKRNGFSETLFELEKSNVREEISDIDTHIQALDKSEASLGKKLKSLLAYKSKLMGLYDYYLNFETRLKSEDNFLNTKHTFLIEGWIRQRSIKSLTKIIERNFNYLNIEISEPEADEVVPVELENKPLITPFEFITKIYGMPKYEELDPTPFLAPFFFLYFGFCVSDAGYGIVLALTCLFVLKKFKLGPTGLRFFRLFFFCGISTIVIGALTGSWFGNMFDMLAEANKVFLPIKRFKDSLVLFDPLKEPTKLLGIALSMGIFQIWFGNIVAGIGNIKNKRYLALLFDQCSMFTFLFGLTGFGLIFLKVIDETRLDLFKYATLVGAIALILTQGRNEKGIGSKLFYGAYNLYSAFSGYLSDILSYSRLWALGLVTGVMASTINLISVQFSQIVVSSIAFLDKMTLAKAVVSTVILVILFISGHMISFLMNLLGAFVHPVRLQFVEFFSKFFKPGGSPFKPFKLETKYTNLKEV